MRAEWSSKDLRSAAKGKLQFTKAQGEQIRSALLRESERQD
jgi:hypothetical protein